MNHFLLGVLTGSERDNIRIVVLAGQQRGRFVPDEGGSYTIDLVGGNLFTISRSTQYDAEGVFSCLPVRDNGLRGVNAESGVVVLRIVGLRAMVVNLESALPQVFLNRMRRIEPRVICSNVDDTRSAHVESFHHGEAALLT